jgi:hypothetical protein
MRSKSQQLFRLRLQRSTCSSSMCGSSTSPLCSTSCSTSFKLWL